MTYIAVLDDDPSTLTTIDTIAAEQNWIIETWSDALALFASLPERRPDLLVADVSPRVPSSTNTLLQELQENTSIHDVPLVISSFDQYALLDAQAVLGQQVRAVLVKPFDAHDFQQCVTAVLLPSEAGSSRVGTSLA